MIEVHAPAPIPADADLRHMPGYMLDVKALLDSDLAAFGEPAANWYAVLTWCAALHQVPAGSLPDDDQMLAYLVRLGRDVRTWRKMRERGALRGWTKHADGRLYHPVVTKTVLSLLAKSKAGRSAAEARHSPKNTQDVENTHVDECDRTASDGNSHQQDGYKGREGKGIEEKGSSIAPQNTAGPDTALQHGNGNHSQGSLVPAEPKVPTRAKKTAVAKRRSRIDPGWKVSEAGQKFAADRGFGPAWLSHNEARFVNYHSSKGSTMADWDAAWRTWVMNAVDFANRNDRGPGGGGRGGRQSRSDDVMEGIFSVLQDHGDEHR